MTETTDVRKDSRFYPLLLSCMKQCCLPAEIKRLAGKTFPNAPHPNDPTVRNWMTQAKTWREFNKLLIKELGSAENAHKELLRLLAQEQRRKKAVLDKRRPDLRQAKIEPKTPEETFEELKAVLDALLDETKPETQSGRKLVARQRIGC